MKEILEFIEKLEKGSFEGWTPEEHNGYLTACYSIKEEINKNLNPSKTPGIIELDSKEEDFDHEPVPCSVCGEIEGMDNPCCAGYDPLSYKNCGYG